MFQSPFFIRLQRTARNGLQNLMRNKLLTIATLLIIGLMVFVFNMMLALNLATDSVIESVGRKVDLSVELQSGVEAYQIDSLLSQLRAKPEVAEVIFVSKTEALEKFGAKYPNIIGFLDRNQLGNPLPDVIRIVSRQVEDNSAIMSFLEQPQFESLVNQAKLKANLDQKSRSEKILAITQFIKKIGAWLNVIFAVVAILIVFNSININIHSHKNEITIMRLVGANLNFIRGAYQFEGVIYAVTALFMSLLFSKVTLTYLTQNLIRVVTNESLLSGFNAILLHFEDRFFFTFFWQLLIALFLGLISSTLAIELYLRKQNA